MKTYSHIEDLWSKNKDIWLPKIKELTEFAKKKNTSIGNLAIAWILKRKYVSTVLLGASKEEQIIDNLKSIDVATKLTNDDMVYIDSILDNKPELPMHYGRFLDKKIELIS